MGFYAYLHCPIIATKSNLCNSLRSRDKHCHLLSCISCCCRTCRVCPPFVHTGRTHAPLLKAGFANRRSLWPTLNRRPHNRRDRHGQIICHCYCSKCSPFFLSMWIIRLCCTRCGPHLTSRLAVFPLPTFFPKWIPTGGMPKRSSYDRKNKPALRAAIDVKMFYAFTNT